MKVVNVNKIIIVGHSQGSLVGIDFGIKDSKLLLIETYGVPAKLWSNFGFSIFTFGAYKCLLLAIIAKPELIDASYFVLLVKL